MNGIESTPEWAAALGKLPSGVFVVTARQEKNETGMLASWVQQCSFEPPQISIAFQKDRYVLKWIENGSPFVVNILGQDQKSMLSHFGRGFEPEDPAFENLEIKRSPGGNAILKEAMAWLECESRQIIDAGDHRLMIAEISSGVVLSDSQPMVHIRKNGTHY